MAKRDALVSLVISIVLPALILFVYTSSFETNDDAAMMMFASGWYNLGEPSEYLVFTHVYIGLGLKFLYQNFSEIPWYGIYLSLFHCICIFSMSYIFLRINKDKLYAYLFFLSLVIFESYYFVLLQFTHVAIWIGVSAYLWLIFSVYTKQRNYIFAGLICISLSVCVRPYGAYGATIICLPVIMYLYCIVAREYKGQLVIGLIVYGFVIIFMQHINNNYYQNSKEWSLYAEYNDARSKIHGNAKVAEIEEDQLLKVLDENNWSENDFNMLRSWFFSDKSTYSLENIENIVGVIPRRSIDFIYDPVKNLAHIYNKFGRYMVMYLVLIAIVLFVMPKDIKYGRYIILGSFLYVVAILLALGGNVRVPLRVGVPIIFSSVLLTIISLIIISQKSLELKTSNSRTRVVSYITILVGLCALYANHEKISSISDRTEKNREHESVKYQLLDKLGEDKVIINWGGEGLKSQYISPWTPVTRLPNIAYLGLGWSIHTPYYNNFLKHYGIDNIYKDIFVNKNVYLLTHDKNISMLTNYMSEHWPEFQVTSLNKIYQYKKMKVYTNVDAKKVIVK